MPGEVYQVQVGMKQIEAPPGCLSGFRVALKTLQNPKTKPKLQRTKPDSRNLNTFYSDQGNPGSS